MTLDEQEDGQGNDRARLEVEYRAAYLRGAEERSRMLFGRPLTQEELETLVAAYPGPPPA